MLILPVIVFCLFLCISSLTIHKDNKIADFPRKFQWKSSGYEKWNWKGHSIGYIDSAHHENDSSKPSILFNNGFGALDSSKPAILLIHGFGASGYHWRYNIPTLSEKYHVFALDLLGFGFSDKPIIDYSIELWKDQVLDFIREIIIPRSNGRHSCTVVGNSLGGATALCAAANPQASSESLISGCILLNAACKFRPAVKLPQDRVDPPSWARKVNNAIQKAVINLSFVYTKRPSRIAQVLTQIYPVRPLQVDADLVESILLPSQHPNAGEVFYRVLARAAGSARGPPLYADDPLQRLSVPLLLLWGSKVLPTFCAHP